LAQKLIPFLLKPSKMYLWPPTHLVLRERERESKSVFLKNATKNLDLLKFLLQIAYQTKALDNKKYITLSEVLYEIGKMIGGWERSLNQNKLF